MPRSSAAPKPSRSVTTKGAATAYPVTIPPCAGFSGYSPTKGATPGLRAGLRLARVHCLGVALALFDYDLPRELIAQAPAPSRDASRLLLIDRARGALEDRVFAELPELLRPGDCLVVNNSRVIPARVLARDAAGRPVELLFVGPEDERRWRALVRPGRRCRVGAELVAGGAPGARLRVVGLAAHGPRLLERLHRTIGDLPRAHGLTPLPPSIRRFASPTPEDPERYHKGYPRSSGSVAAPS